MEDTIDCLGETYFFLVSEDPDIVTDNALLKPILATACNNPLRCTFKYLETKQRLLQANRVQALDIYYCNKDGSHVVHETHDLHNENPWQTMAGTIENKKLSLVSSTPEEKNNLLLHPYSILNVNLACNFISANDDLLLLKTYTLASSKRRYITLQDAGSAAQGFDPTIISEGLAQFIDNGMAAGVLAPMKKLPVHLAADLLLFN